MAEWFYAQKEERLGPVAVDQIRELAANGDLMGSSLVWREGLQDWLPLSEVADEIYTTQTATCAHSGRVFLKSEMLQYGDAWIAPDYKEAYLQNLMESGGPVAGDAGYDQGMQFVGFWWRVLGMLVDGLVLLIPTLALSIPYIMISSETADPTNPLAGYTGDAGIAYLLTTLATGALRMIYEVWMVGKFQGTVGKMAIGAKVVSPDGSKITYGRSFLRWLGKIIINYIIIYTIAGIPLVIWAVSNAQALTSGSMSEDQIVSLGLTMMLTLLLMIVASFPYYMAGFTKQKQALHDMMFSTRVVKK